MTRYKVVIVAPTCFYYQAPIFKILAADPRIDLIVYFCSDEAITGEDITKKFRSEGTWTSDNELLHGYKYRFLRNYSPTPSYVHWPFGLINLGITSQLRTDRPDFVILMSWMNPTWWQATLTCLALKIPFLYMTDQNVQVEPLKPKWKTWPKTILLGKLIFRLAAGFLCAGTANKMLYQYYGVPNEKLYPFAFCWVQEEMMDIAGPLKEQKSDLRNRFNIPQNDTVILYCGRLSEEKNITRMLQAYHQLKLKNTTFILLGDGPLRKELEDYVSVHNLQSVIFSGFQNRKDIPKYYAVSDLLVLPSLRETWGMVINEALCFGLPVIVSEQVGASKDLVIDDFNGISFRGEDTITIMSALQRHLNKSKQEQTIMGSRSRQIIEEWSTKDLAETFVNSLDSIRAK